MINQFTSIILLSFLALSCKSQNEIVTPKAEFKLVNSFSLQLYEPSGLAFDETENALWLVCGRDQRVYKIDLMGNIIQKLNYVGDDLEGIAYDLRDKTLWVVEERTREVVHLNANGNELLRMPIAIDGAVNNGLEGICFDDQWNMFVLNEKKPGVLLELNQDFSIHKKHDLEFALDYSDVNYNDMVKNFYILSDESKAIFVWNSKDGIKAKFDLPWTKGEGIAVNKTADRIFIANDSLATLFEFQYK